MNDSSRFRRAMRMATLALMVSACGNSSETTETPAELVARGAAEVSQRGCPSCHQSSDGKAGVLSGQSTPLGGTTSYGPNLTPDMDTGIGSWSDDQILGALRAGVDDEGAKLCATMPRFVVADDDGRAIIAYLRSLAPEKHEIPESQCP